MSPKTDLQIQQDVSTELKWDTRLAPYEIDVSVHRGAVTLRGTVATYAIKLAAAEAAHRIGGVLDVANDLAVRVPGSVERSDPEIAEAVRAALEWDVLVPHERIQSTVSNGIVTLLGEVDHATERDDAARAIRNLEGVRAVVNDVKVHAQQVARQAVADAIRQALERHAHRDAERIELAVNDGTVTMTGKVHSWAERAAAIGAAWGTHGVEAVVDRLRIEP